MFEYLGMGQLNNSVSSRELSPEQLTCLHIMYSRGGTKKNSACLIGDIDQHLITIL